MVHIKALLAGLVGVSLCMANISGIITDTGTTPISGAVVQLEKGGWSATTGADGSFTLGASTGILPGDSKLLPNGLSAGITGNLMTVRIGERAIVEVATFDLNGKALSNVRQTMETGVCTLPLPQRSAGVYLYKVKSGNRVLLFKGNTIGGASFGSAVSSQGPASNHLAKQAASTVAINDVIAATKTGYLNYRCVQHNSDTTGVKIKMIVCADTVWDIDRNLYHAVRIGNQIWTVENLRTTKYNDGMAITQITSYYSWAACSSSHATAYRYYNFNATNVDSIKKWGALYNWYAVNTGKLAPTGWHVPTDAEWEEMQSYLVMHGYNFDGTTDTNNNKIAISLAAKTDWYSDTITGTIGKNLTQNNSSGFSALPGGQCYSDGILGYIGSNGYWWSATEFVTSNATYAYYRNLLYVVGNLKRNFNVKSCGFSVRLVRNPSLPSAPVISSAVAGNGSVTVSWNTVSGATSYNLYYAAGTTVTMTSGTKMAGVTSPKQVSILTNGKQYAFALSSVNMSGESGLSSVMTSTPLAGVGGTVTDTDGNVYQTVTIGTQVWMAENLRVTKYKDGSAITKITDSASWYNIYTNNLTTPAYCFYNNMTNADSIKKWGALYNWFAVKTGMLAPAGWHVPSDAEWKVMQNYLVVNGYNYDGTTDTANNKIAMALASRTDWSYVMVSGYPGNNLTMNNSSGFSALPGGSRDYVGGFHFQSIAGYWWSATESDASNACDRIIYYGGSNLNSNYIQKSCGFSVRLVKD